MRKFYLLLALLLGLSAGLGGEILLILQKQCSETEKGLRSDFTVLMFLKGEIDPGKEKVLEEKLLALPDVEQVHYVSQKEAMGRLKQEDPDLVESVAWLGENPLNPAYEIRLAPSGFGHIVSWLDEAQKVADWADIRYKEEESRAILQAQFYGHLIGMIQSSIICLIAFMALAALWFATRFGFRLGALLAGGCAALGALGGEILGLAMASPLRFLAAWWAWPSLVGQAVLIMVAAVVGWSLCVSGE